MSTTAYHQGFTITNLSHYKLVLASINHQYVDDQMPKIGTVMQPGEAIGFQIAWRFGWTQRPSPVFQVIGDDGSVIGDYVPVLQVNEWNTPSSYIHAIPAVLAHTEGGNTLTVTDPAGTVIDIPARDGATQAKVLTELCGNSAVECTFAPTGQQRTAGPRHTVFETYNNSSMENLSVGEWSENVSVTQSLELTASVEASILDIVEIGFSATYGHSWTTDHAFARTEQMKSPARLLRTDRGQPAADPDHGRLHSEDQQRHGDRAGSRFDHARPGPQDHRLEVRSPDDRAGAGHRPGREEHADAGRDAAHGPGHQVAIRTTAVDSPRALPAGRPASSCATCGRRPGCHPLAD